VDTPDGGQYGQSFGRTGDVNDGVSDASSAGEPALGEEGQGMVYADLKDPTIKVQDTLKTTSSQDANIKKWLESQVGNTGPYHPLFNSCRDYSSSTFDDIKEKLKNGYFGK